MQDRIQFKEVKNEFAKFGTFLIIFAFVFIIQIIISITEEIMLFSAPSNTQAIQIMISVFNVLDIISWILLVIYIIILILMIYEIKKISNLAKDPKSDRMFTAFITMLIFILISTFISVIYIIIASKITYVTASYIIIFNQIIGIIATIFQLLAWIFMYSFILNTHGLFPEKYKNKLLGYLIILMISISIVIFNELISYLISPIYAGEVITFRVMMFLILPDLVGILVFIGYILLGSHLRKIKSPITQTIDSTGRKEDLNIEPKMDDKLPKKSFCRNCGARVESGMSFCTECGKPID